MNGKRLTSGGEGGDAYEELALEGLPPTAAAPEEHFRIRLNWIRRLPHSIDEAVMGAAEALANKLNREIEMGHDVMAFTIALLLAAAMDGLDWGVTILAGLVGLIPLIGQALAAALLAGGPYVKLFLWAFLTYFLWSKGWLLKWRVRLGLRIGLWLLSLIFENIPGINLLPLNVITVLWAWRNVRHAAAEAEEDMRKLERDLEDLAEEAAETEESAPMPEVAPAPAAQS